MDHNWGYVAAGYLITAATVAGYAGWLRRRSAIARRSLREDAGG